MTEKMLFVSCHVPQSGVYDLLTLLTAAKVGNVEVRPIGPVLALPSPDHVNGTGKPTKRRHGANAGDRWNPRVRLAMLACMKPGDKVRAIELAKQTGQNPKSI